MSVFPAEISVAFDDVDYRVNSCEAVVLRRHQLWGCDMQDTGRETLLLCIINYGLWIDLLTDIMIIV